MITYYVLIGIAGILGAVVGSFLYALVLRWGRGESIIMTEGVAVRDVTAVNRMILEKAEKKEVARSRCESCGTQLRWFELIPIVSFLLQRGRCRGCGARLSWEYLGMEIAGAVLAMIPVAVFSWYLVRPLMPIDCDGCIVGGLIESNFFGIPYALIFRITLAMLIGWTLLFIFVYDAKYRVIPHRINIFFIVLALLGSGLLLNTEFQPAMIGAVIAGGFFALQFGVSRGTWIGGGDILLGIGMGLLLGWEKVIVALILAYIVGALYAVWMLATGRAKKETQIAFGTFLALATYATIFFGSAIVNWYYSLMF